MKRKFIIVALVGLGLLAAIPLAWSEAFPSGTWRYKMTVTVGTPDGVKIGSAVREVTYSSGPRILPDVASSTWKVKGEAVVVDLGKEKYLFTLLDTDGSYQIVHDVFPYDPKSGKTYVEYYRGLIGKTKPLMPSQYPRFITFGDIKDPKTVKSIKPDDLSEIGKGVVLRGISLEMTGEPITWGIEKWLTWLPGRKGIKGSLGGSPDKPFEDPTGLYLTGVEFSKGRF